MHKEKSATLKLPLQFFAEDGAGAAGNAANADGTVEEPGEGTAPPSFDDLLKNKDYQSEFDKRVNKALETARAKWDEQKRAELTEQEKLAKMKADEKAQYEREKREKALGEREALITRRELTASAKETLIEKGLPPELSAVLNYESADACKESLDAVEKVFQAAVEKAVNGKLRSQTPKQGAENGSGGASVSTLSEALREKMKGR